MKIKHYATIAFITGILITLLALSGCPAVTNEPAKQYTVTFNTNNGTSIPSQTITAGGTVTEPAEPVKPGFIFAGWFTAGDYKTPWNFTDDTVTENLNLYAKWVTQTATFTVTFNTDNGASIPSQTITAGGTVTEPAEPVKPGFIFAGWFTAGDYKTPWNFTDDTVTENLNLYAKWVTQTATFTVTFNTDNGASIPSQTITAGGTVTKPATPAHSTPGKVFGGWFTSTNYNTTWKFDDEVTANLSLYALWVDDVFEVTSGAIKVKSGKDLAGHVFTPAELDGIPITAIAENAFAYQEHITGITLYSGITGIGKNAFFRCLITSIIIPSSVTTIGEAAFTSSNLTNITLPPGITEIAESTFEFCTSLTAVNIPSAVTIIGAYAFAGCEKLDLVTINSAAVAISSTAFNNSGKTLVINATGGAVTGSGVFSSSTFTTATITGASLIGEKVFDGTSLTEVTITSGGGTEIGPEAFANSTLQKATLTGVSKIGDFAFAFCSLNEVTINSAAVAIGNTAFENNGKTLVINVTGGAVTGSGAFSSSTFTTATITGASLIGERVFEGTSLTEVTITSGGGTEIGSQAFSSSRLQKATLTGVSKIDDFAFASCYLKEVTISKGITNIGEKAFAFNGSLTSVTILEPVAPNLGTDAFKSTASGLIIYIPSGSADSYSKNSGWFGLHIKER